MPGSQHRHDDFELGLLQDAFPEWDIERGGGLIRADRDGFKTRFTQSAAVMMVVLADIQFTSHLAESCPSGSTAGPRFLPRDGPY
jgi:hypothetical protein